MRPEKISLVDQEHMKLVWNDGEEKLLSLQFLRKYCPCATCEKERSEWSNLFIPLFMKNQITLKEIRPVGSYAINLIWNDGHNTGIYEFARLRTMEEKG